MACSSTEKSLLKGVTEATPKPENNVLYFKFLTTFILKTLNI